MLKLVGLGLLGRSCSSGLFGLVFGFFYVLVLSVYNLQHVVILEEVFNCGKEFRFDIFWRWIHKEIDFGDT